MSRYGKPEPAASYHGGELVRVDGDSQAHEETVTVYAVSGFNSASPSRTSQPRRPSLSASWDTIDRYRPRPPLSAQRSQSHTSVSKMSTPPALSHRAEAEVIIMVMGMTGSGKSSFINLISDQEVKVGHSLESCTTDPKLYPGPVSRNGRVYFIDTPGFDDTSRPDVEVLKGIAFYLNTLHQGGKRLAGLIYMHRITDVRMGGAALRNLELFRKICGPSTFRHLALVTTMWGVLRGEEGKRMGQQREQALVSEPGFWKEFRDGGSRVMRHDGTKQSALRILHSLPVTREGFVLDLQDEMMKGLQLNETTAGLFLGQELDKVRKKYEQELQELQKELDAAQAEKNTEETLMLREEHKSKVDELRLADAEVKNLNLNARTLVREKAPEFRENIQRQRSEEIAQDATLKEHADKMLQLEDEIAYLRKKDKVQQQQIDALERQTAHGSRSKIHPERQRRNRQRRSRSPSPTTQRVAELRAKHDKEEAEVDRILQSRGSPAAFLKTVFDEAARYVIDSLPNKPVRRSSTEPSRYSEFGS